MLIIFDCDGVLLDSELIFCSVDSAALARLGYEVSAVDVAKRFTGVPFREMWRELSDELRFTVSEAWLDDLRSECERRFQTELTAIPGVDRMVEQAGRLGHTLCVASSTSLALLKRNLEIAAIRTYFDPHIFSVSQVARGKPAPDVFLFAASQMGFDPSDCLVIEDSVAGVTAGRRAGMTVIGFNGGSHADPDLADRLLSSGATTVLRSMADVSTWLHTIPTRPGV